MNGKYVKIKKKFFHIFPKKESVTSVYVNEIHYKLECHSAGSLMNWI